ncbi:uncharacterized protein SRS1_13171 [Sporisorium reilianum f. sp. reilianum]|uniref:Homeobox domain-containing protein n=1 Tax=Sporisorium reilianum f. sp. reilianum TaxID=72559 RepID=A0A2N8UBD1_9BASI|nr:uncharacterized protein SRS1_13171 [Sporisorium reilianum f. sp. reilianum]
MHQAHHQSRFPGHLTHHYLPPQQQQMQHQQPHYPGHHHAPPSQQQLQHQQQQYSQQQLQQQQHQQQHDMEQPQQMARGGGGGSSQGFTVPRSVTASGWMSSANPAVHLHSMASSASAAGPGGAASASAPSSSSSSGSLLSYWDHGTTSDSELTMASAMTPTDPHHSLGEMARGGGGGGHQRYASTASLPAFSPSGVAGGHASSSHSYMTAGSDHYHPYRAVSMSMAGPAQQHAYHSAHQQSALSTGSAYSSASGQMAASPGFVYGPSAGSSAPLGPGSGYDAYASASAPPSSSSYSQYVSYLPPAMSHDSRFYPLNPFEIKHRRRTTKTQFRVLESTFREVPKPNATLRKQISAQLDMPVRAVQIWFQNRRAKAKAMEKKKQTGGGAGSSSAHTGGGAVEDQGRAPSGMVVASGHHAYRDASERYGASHGDDAMRAGQAPQYEYASRAPGRLMDLPPIRMSTAASAGAEDNYTLSSASTSASTAPTLPSIDSGLLLDRRQLPPPSLSASMPMPSAAMSSLPHAQDDGIERAGSTPDSHHTATGSTLSAAAGVSSVSDRSVRMSSLSGPYLAREPPAPPALPSMGSRAYDAATAEQHANRFWPAGQQ